MIDRTVREFESEFNRLSVYTGRVMEGEQARVRRFMLGLRPELRTHCLGRVFGTLESWWSWLHLSRMV